LELFWPRGGLGFPPPNGVELIQPEGKGERLVGSHQKSNWTEKEKTEGNESSQFANTTYRESRKRRMGDQQHPGSQTIKIGR